MPQHNGQRCLVLRDGQQTFVDHNLTARHTEGINLLVLHQIELPLILCHLAGQSVCIQIGDHRIGQILPYPLDHSRIGGIRRGLGRLHILSILLIRQAQHLLVRNQQRSLSTRDRHCRRRTTAHQNGSYQGQQYDSYLFHLFIN